MKAHALKGLLSLALLAHGAFAIAQNATTTPVTAAQAPQPWIYKTTNLSKSQVDALLADPQKLVIIDLRRPDELVKYGSFPAYLNVQLKALPDVLDYIPKDRVILTVSNRAHRAGAAGDLLTSKGFKVAGATGSEDYREAGGTIVKIAPAAPAASK